MKGKKVLLLLGTVLSVCGILIGIFFFVSPVVQATEIPEKLLPRYRSNSGYIYGTDGIIYHCGFTVGIRSEFDSYSGESFEVADVIFDVQNLSCYPVLEGNIRVDTTCLVYLPEVDEYILVTESHGSTGSGSTICESGNFGLSGYGGFEYNGEKLYGEIQSVAAEFYFRNRLIESLTISRED